MRRDEGTPGRRLFPVHAFAQPADAAILICTSFGTGIVSCTRHHPWSVPARVARHGSDSPAGDRRDAPRPLERLLL
jgi:hypothetical protein